MLKKEPTRVVLVFKMPESAIVNWLKLPGVSIVTDGMPMVPDDGLTWDTPFEKLPNTHPRAAGSYAEALRLARENKIPLMQIVAMSSYNSAKPLGKMGLKAMQERGRMQEGMVADITIFDPQTVTDNVTYAKGTLPSTGILHVIVNGTIVVKNSEVLKGVNPGQPIRFEPVKSRFKPLSVESWTKEFYAAPIDFGGGVPGSQPDIKRHLCCTTQRGHAAVCRFSGIGVGRRLAPRHKARSAPSCPRAFLAPYKPMARKPLTVRPTAPGDPGPAGLSPDLSCVSNPLLARPGCPFLTRHDL